MEEDIKFPFGAVVVDASTVLNFLMPDENTPSEVDLLFEQIKLQNVKANAPEIINYEVANSLRSAVLSKRVSSKIAVSVFNGFANLGIASKEVDYAKILRIAVSERLSVYDASYVYLADSLGVHLATSDKNMSKAAKKSFYFELKNTN